MHIWIGSIEDNFGVSLGVGLGAARAANVSKVKASVPGCHPLPSPTQNQLLHLCVPQSQPCTYHIEINRGPVCATKLTMYLLE